MTNKRPTAEGVLDEPQRIEGLPPSNRGTRTTRFDLDVVRLQQEPGVWFLVRIGTASHHATPYRQKGCKVKAVAQPDGSVHVYACWPADDDVEKQPTHSRQKKVPEPYTPTAEQIALASQRWNQLAAIMADDEPVWVHNDGDVRLEEVKRAWHALGFFTGAIADEHGKPESLYAFSAELYQQAEANQRAAEAAARTPAPERPF
jgi:hypothetical protein